MSHRDRWGVDAGWRAGNKQQVRVLERHPACIYALRLLPDSQRMVSAGADEEVVVWCGPCKVINKPRGDRLYSCMSKPCVVGMKGRVGSSLPSAV